MRFGADQRGWLRLSPLAIGLLLGSCRLIVDADEGDLGPPPATCSPGQENPCACPGGTQGGQFCSADGSRYDACVCPPSGAAGTGF